MSTTTAPNSVKVRIPWRIERLPSSSFMVAISTVLILTYFFTSVDQGAIGYFLPMFAKEFNIDSATLGWLGSVSSIGAMAGALVAGLITDLFGRKKIIVISMFGWGVSGLLLASASNLTMLMVARVLIGVFLGAQVPATITLLSELIPSRLRAKYITALMAVLPVGSAVAGLVSYFFMPTIGWRGVALVEALPALAAILVIKFVPESAFWLESKGRHEEADAVMVRIEKGVEKSIGKPLPPVEVPIGADQHTGEAPKVPIADLFSKKYAKTTIMVTIWWFTAVTGVIGLVTWFSVLMMSKGFSMTSSIGYVSLMYFAGVLGIPVVRWMLEHIGRKWSAVIVGVATAVAAYFYGISSSLPLIITFGILYNIASYSTGMVNITYTPELYPTHMRGTAVGYANVMGNLGGAFGPIAIGYIMQGYGPNAVFLFGGSMYLAFSIIIALLGKETKGIVFSEQ